MRFLLFCYVDFLALFTFCHSYQNKCNFFHHFPQRHIVLISSNDLVWLLEKFFFPGIFVKIKKKHSKKNNNLFMSISLGLLRSWRIFRSFWELKGSFFLFILEKDKKDAGKKMKPQLGKWISIQSNDDKHMNKKQSFHLFTSALPTKVKLFKTLRHFFSAKAIKTNWTPVKNLILTHCIVVLRIHWNV